MIMCNLQNADVKHQQHLKTEVWQPGFISHMITQKNRQVRALDFQSQQTMQIHSWAIMLESQRQLRW